MGKLAGSGRKMLADLQQLSYNDDGHIFEKPAIQLTFERLQMENVEARDMVRLLFESSLSRSIYLFASNMQHFFREMFSLTSL